MQRCKYGVKQKLEILGVVERTGQITKTANQFNISRTQLHRYRKCFANDGVLGLINHPPIKKTHNHKHSEEDVKKILLLVLDAPTISCAMIARRLKQSGVDISSMSVFKILKKHQLENKTNRWKFLEENLKSGKIKSLSANQKLFLKLLNPYFSGYENNKLPVQYISQDIISIKCDGKVMYVYIIVDTFSNYIFATLEEKKHTKYLVKVLKQAIEFMHLFDTSSISVSTSDLSIFYGDEECCPYQQFLKKHNIKQKKIFVRPDYDGCIRQSADNIKKSLQGNGDYEKLKNRLYHWLLRHNHSFTYSYYPNYGVTPIQMLRNTLERKRLWHKVSPFLDKQFILPLFPKQPNKVIDIKNSVSFLSTFYSYQLFDK